MKLDGSAAKCARNAADDIGPVMEDMQPAEPLHAPACFPESLVAQPILLRGLRQVVRPLPVELDNEASMRPGEVRLDSGNTRDAPHVDLWLRKPGLQDALEEMILAAVLRACTAALEELDRAAHGLDARNSPDALRACPSVRRAPVCA